MSGQAISRIIKTVVADKKNIDIDVDIYKLNVNIDNLIPIVDFDADIRCDYFKNPLIMVGVGTQAYKLFVPKIISIINKGLIKSPIYKRGLDIKATKLRIESLNLMNKNHLKAKGEMVLNSSNMSEFLSGELTKIVNEKAGLNIEIQNTSFSPLHIEVLENGNVSINLIANILSKNPGIIGELAVNEGALQKFLANRIVNAIKKSLNAEIALNIKSINITAVSNGVEISLSADAEISDEAVSEIFEKVYRKKYPQ